jgi:hypothetical protein
MKTLERIVLNIVGVAEEAIMDLCMGEMLAIWDERGGHWMEAYLAVGFLLHAVSCDTASSYTVNATFSVSLQTFRSIVTVKVG